MMLNNFILKLVCMLAFACVLAACYQSPKEKLLVEPLILEICAQYKDQNAWAGMELAQLSRNLERANFLQNNGLLACAESWDAIVGECDRFRIFLNELFDTTLQQLEIHNIDTSVLRLKIVAFKKNMLAAASKCEHISQNDLLRASEAVDSLFYKISLNHEKINIDAYLVNIRTIQLGISYQIKEILQKYISSKGYDTLPNIKILALSQNYLSPKDTVLTLMTREVVEDLMRGNQKGVICCKNGQSIGILQRNMYQFIADTPQVKKKYRYDVIASFGGASYDNTKGIEYEAK